jgi:ATP-binding cassette subfamily F protein 3
MLKAINLKKEFGSTLLLDGVNFSVKEGDKVGLIGRNGTGKTTLFKLILKEEDPTEGNLSTKGEKIGYLTQEFDFSKYTYIEEFYQDVTLVNNDYWRMEMIVGKLGMIFDPYQQIQTLSGGEKMRLKLAQLLYDEPTTLLLDEPTNHLDIKGIQWLKRFINGFEGTILIISHDRDLLNDTVNKIFEIDEKKVLVFDGNYNDYLQQKDRWKEIRRQQFNRFLERKKKLETLLEKAQRGEIRSRSGSATEAAKKRIEREITKREVKEYDRKEYSEFDIEGSVHRNKLVLRVSNATKKYGDRTVFEGIDLEIRGGEKIWLFGENGQGKTTLVKAILGLESLDGGQIKIGENVNIGYFEQKQNPLNIEERLLEYYSKNTLTDYYSVPNALGKYLFTEEDLDKPVRLLSPGQQARLKFALFAESSGRKAYQFLILDEPAQHLDIETKEVVERAINNFNGAVLLISHDLYSIQSIELDREIELADGGLIF